MGEVVHLQNFREQRVSVSQPNGPGAAIHDLRALEFQRNLAKATGLSAINSQALWRLREYAATLFHAPEPPTFEILQEEHRKVEFPVIFKWTQEVAPLENLFPRNRDGTGRSMYFSGMWGVLEAKNFLDPRDDITALKQERLKRLGGVVARLCGLVNNDAQLITPDDMCLCEAHGYFSARAHQFEFNSKILHNTMPDSPWARIQLSDPIAPYEP